MLKQKSTPTQVSMPSGKNADLLARVTMNQSLSGAELKMNTTDGYKSKNLTDNQDERKRQLELRVQQRLAEAKRKWQIAHGIDPDKIPAKPVVAPVVKEEKIEITTKEGKEEAKKIEEQKARV